MCSEERAGERTELGKTLKNDWSETQTSEIQVAALLHALRPYKRRALLAVEQYISTQRQRPHGPETEGPLFPKRPHSFPRTVERRNSKHSCETLMRLRFSSGSFQVWLDWSERADVSSFF